MTDLISLLGEVALRSSLILIAVFSLLFVMRRASASERHLVILFGLLVTAFVPLGLLLGPKISWTMPLLRQAQIVEPVQQIRAYWGEENTTAQPPVSSPIVKERPSVMEFLTLSNGLIVLLVGGMFVQSIILGRAAWSWQKIRRGAVKATLPVDALEQAQLFAGTKQVPPVFASGQITIPLLAGWLRPEIILPTEASRWPSKRLRMVLCHELAHFRRGDSRLLPLICALRIFYWWHPLVWLALARLRRERENACDDLVLNHHFRATDYADLIVFTARQAGTFRWQGGALAMATSSNFGERVQAILDPALNRRPASQTTIFAGSILAIALGWFFIAAQVQAEDQPITSDSSAVAVSSKPQIELKFMVVGIDEKVCSDHQAEIDADLEKLAKGDISFFKFANNTKGISLFSLPTVATQAGQKAHIEVVRELPYATKFEKNKDGKIVPVESQCRDLGPQIEAVPTFEADGKTVRLKFKGEIASFEGWVPDPSAEGQHQPAFNVRRVEAERLMNDSNGNIFDYVWMDQGAAQHGAIFPLDGDNDPASTKESAHKQRVVMLFSAHIIKKDHAQAGHQPQLVPVSTSSSLSDAAVTTKPFIKIDLKVFEIDETTYQEQSSAMDEALKNGELSFFSHFQKFDLLSDGSTIIKTGFKGEIWQEKELVQKNVPTTTLAAQETADANGAVNQTVTTTTNMSPGPTKTPLGVEFKVTPSIVDAQTILLRMRYQLGEVTEYKKDGDFAVSTSITDKDINAIDGKSYGFWIGEKHDFSLYDILKSPENQITTLPPLSAYPHRLAFILTAHKVTKWPPDL